MEVDSAYLVPKYKTFRGEIKLRGDKSISHRVLIFSSMCENQETKIYNIGFSDDINATQRILMQLGVEIINENGFLKACGKGIYFDEPSDIIYAYESGTTARIFCSILAPQKFSSVLDGKESLRRRPMKRVVEPLKKLGAKIWGKDDASKLPLVFDGVSKFKGGVSFDLSVASAQVKTALLISNFWSDSPVKVREPFISRDHTERILPSFNVDIRSEAGYIYAVGKPKSPGVIMVPGDISSASFIIAASVLSHNSDVLIKDVSLNPTRLGFVEVLKNMGANLKIYKTGQEIGEDYGDISASSSELKNIELKGDIIPKIIDEIPILSVCAIFGEGVFRVRDAKELRVKETDRINAICSNLRSLGIDVQEYEDGFSFEGIGNSAYHKFSGDYLLKTFGDHRIAMSFFIFGSLINGNLYLDDISCVSKSYPDFLLDIKKIGIC